MKANHRRTTRQEARLPAAELADLRQRLEAERLRLVALYRDDVRRERAIEFGEAEDVIDRALKGSLREEESALAESEREQLRLVEEALARMADGTYGLCQESGEPIPLARLRAVPWARYALTVQEEVEESAVAQPAPAAGTEVWTG